MMVDMMVHRELDWVDKLTSQLFSATCATKRPSSGSLNFPCILHDVASSRLPTHCQSSINALLQQGTHNFFFIKRLKNDFAQGVEDFQREPHNFWGSNSQFFGEETVISPVDNLPGVWNDPHSVAADDDVDDVDVDPGQRHLPLSQSTLRI